MAKKRIPLHPGAFIKGVYIEEGELTITAIAEGLGVNKSTLSRIMRGQTDVTPSMAVKLSVVLGRTAESWLSMQQAHSLAKAQAEIKAARWKPAKRLVEGRLEAA
ncbi:HigA family addiction module antitoxin [Congregibacter sp.]|uniref:HigA family addiction module antitoxin n=1 Tax=Congregibacter sp. TaxID=2744308 RepID=UPI00385D2BFC